MIDWILKQLMTWYADRDDLLGNDCFPAWLRQRIRKSQSLQLHEKRLQSISMSLRRESSEHLEQIVSFMRSYESPMMVGSVKESESQTPRNALNGKPAHLIARHWGTWTRLSIAVCSIVFLSFGARWTYTLLTTRVVMENVGQNSPKSRKTPERIDTDRLLQSSIAIGQRWSRGLESKKNSMKREVDQLDRRFVAEARDLRKRSVHFVTHHVPVSAVRMFLPSSEPEPN